MHTCKSAVSHVCNSHTRFRCRLTCNRRKLQLWSGTSQCLFCCRGEIINLCCLLLVVFSFPPPSLPLSLSPSLSPSLPLSLPLSLSPSLPPSLPLSWLGESRLPASGSRSHSSAWICERQKQTGVYLNLINTINVLISCCRLAWHAAQGSDGKSIQSRFSAQDTFLFFEETRLRNNCFRMSLS